MDGSAARGSKLESLGQMSRLLSTLGDYFQTTLIFNLLPIGWQVTMVVDDGHRPGIVVVKPTGRFGLEEKIVG